MERWYMSVIALLLIGFVIIAGCTTTLPANESGLEETDTTSVYIVGIDGDYAPYSYIDRDGNPAGFDVESIEWIADEMGFQVKIQPVEWNRIIPALLEKEIDMIYSGMSITDERRELVAFTRPYWTANQSIAVRNESGIAIDDIMEGKAVIGTERGSTAAAWTEDTLVYTGKMPAENLALYGNISLAINALEEEHVDAVIFDLPVLKEAILERPLMIVGILKTGERYGIAVRKGDAELLETLNEGLDRLMDSPEWQELIEKYKLA
jgi:polar amino acid transport system substrate-binding protein